MPYTVFRKEVSMSKKKTKRKNPALRPPPLSGLDKVIYVFLFLFVIAVAFATILPVVLFQRKIAMADPSVMASEARGTMFWILPFVLYVMIGGLCFFIDARQKKQPIFGKKGIRYGAPEWKEVYPLFMKDRPRAYIRPREQRLRRLGMHAALITLAITVLLAPLSLCGRNSLREDMSMTVYSVFNREICRYEQDEIETVTYVIYYKSYMSRGPHGYHLRADIRMQDGKTYSYTTGVDTLFYIKSQVPLSKIRYRGEENLEGLIRDRRYDVDEAAKVRMIFNP